MPNRPPARVVVSSELGRGGRAVDVSLGASAMAPLAAASALALVSGPSGRAFARAASAVWSGSLLAFLAGVRRGLTFSEVEGARPSELATFLAVYGVGVLTLALRSPRVGAAGFALVGAVDALAARRGEAPRYFRQFRPIQLGLGALLLASVGAADRGPRSGPGERRAG